MRRLGIALVRGRSMEPTLREADRLLVLYGGCPRPGRMALLRLPDSPAGPRPLSVKRITGPDPDGGPGWWIDSDNAAEGVSSRTIGPIATDDVLAVVLLRLPRWPRHPHRTPVAPAEPAE